MLVGTMIWWLDMHPSVQGHAVGWTQAVAAEGSAEDEGDGGHGGQWALRLTQSPTQVGLRRS